MQPVVPAGLPPKDILDAVFSVLLGYVSMPTAQSVLGVARQRAGMSGGQLTREQLWELLDPIERSLGLFLGDRARARLCRRTLEALASPPSGPSSSPGGPSSSGPPSSSVARGATVLAIRVEEDIAKARAEARTLAASLGFSVVGQTRLMTAVSELARNIVQYAGEGQVELAPSSSPPGLSIVAKDRGPGIPNLDRIMAGDYRSRLGMGLGLRGVKKLSERFDVRTEVGRGTTVSALLKVS